MTVRNKACQAPCRAPQPVAGAAFQQPVAGAGIQQPVAGAAFQQLVAGAAFQQPVAGAAFQQPWAAFQQPVAGAAFQQPVAGAAFQQPVIRVTYFTVSNKTFIILLTLLAMLYMYFYGVNLLMQMARFLRLILHLYVPVSWLQSNRNIVDDAMKCNADGICLTDYALESAGGSVLYSSETYFSKSGWMYSLFGLKLWYHSSSSREVIQPGIQPGRYWSMNGSVGLVIIKLAMPVIVSAISLEHAPINLSASTDIDCTPRNFFILGLERSANSRSILLGRFTYKIGEESIQTFKIKEPICLGKTDYYSCGTDNNIFSYITLGILNNYGNPNFTCIYRFRVHGQPVSLSPAD